MVNNQEFAQLEKFKIKGKLFFSICNRYDNINQLILNYISIAIKDSDVSDFYRYIIAMKNLLRATEYTGKAGIFGIRYNSLRLLRPLELFRIIRQSNDYAALS